jgi:hypothetical protein
MEKISVMLSSTVHDLEADRDAVLNILWEIDFFNFLGAHPMKYASNKSPYATIIQLAENCDLMLLLLGGNYGYQSENKKSATEIEFDSAFRKDPTKILVFRKQLEKIDDDQKKFIEKVSSYRSGYWFVNYRYTHELQKIVKNAVFGWLKERAAIGKNLTYYDHFIRLAVQRKLTDETSVSYCVNEDFVEFRYRIFNKTYVLQFDKSQIHSDFWECIMKIDNTFEEWRKSWKNK